MLREKLLIALLASVALCGATSALADAVGAYLGLQGGFVNYDLDVGDFPAGAGVTNVSDNALGIRFYGGYQFAKHWAAELALTWFDSADVTAGGIKLDVDNWSIDLAAKGILPIRDKFSFYSKLGPSYVSQDRGGVLGSDEEQITLYYAIGFQYDLIRNFSADVSFNQWVGVGDLGNSYLIAGGVSYSFSGF